jgi:hypothetical protein
MRRKLVHLAMALAAWAAFAVAPTLASASPVLTYPTGTPLATGSLLQITNVGVALFTEPEWNILCPTARFTGKLTTNSGTNIEVDLSSMEIHGIGAGGDCRQDRKRELVTEEGLSVNVVYSGLPWCLNAGKGLPADEFQIRGRSCTEAAKPVTLVFTYTGVSECKYQATSIRGTFTTHPQDVRMAIATQLFEKEIGSSFLCPSTIGSDTELTMERDSATPEPVYIS